jgi:signal transduction histidine kinase/CheY-like chemotaxis protein
MKLPILTVEIRFEHDVVLARQRARQISALLGFDRQDQVRIATAVSEIARNAFQYAGGASADFAIEGGQPQSLAIRISDRGKGIANLKEILQGRYHSPTGMGIGILGAKRLMDQFQIDSTPGSGATVMLAKNFPRRAPPVTQQTIGRLTEELTQHAPQNPFEEIQGQNQELLATLSELQRRTTELAHLNRELEDTNRGVVALYAELDEKADYLRRASELKSRFLSNMTHEFRTPLNSILSLARMLLDRMDGELAPEQERQVFYIKRAATELSELVNDLLDLAKVEAGKIVIRSVEFQVAELFGALRGMLRPLLAHNASVNLVFDEPAGIPPLNTDESKVSQILRNFISNALKYTEQGEVRVSARLEPNDRVTFSVRDTGIGIAPEDESRIFEEFAQVEGPHQSHSKGTGLGLPLSKKLAELLGGEISMRSDVSRGSIFSVTIPILYQGPMEVTDVPPVSREIDPIRRPVLVVDDNPETVFVYEKYLKGSGFQVIPAHTLAEANKALSQFRPFAIILDILLERENTWQFLEHLKFSQQTRQIPVYVVTMVENRHKALALGADDFQIKPVDREWLLNRLKSQAEERTVEQILVIDDDEVSRYLLKGLLSDTRYNVIEAAGGQEGLNMARRIKPSAIFLDVVMPDLNGFEVLDQLKTDPDTRHIPVVAVTSKLLSDEERKHLDEKTVDVLSKDHSAREVSVTKVRDALKRAQLDHLHETPANHG